MIIDFQNKLFEALEKSSLKNLIKGIYFQVPSNSSLPYLVLGDFKSKNISTKTEKKYDVTFKINFFSKDLSLVRIQDIVKLIINETKYFLPRCYLREERVIFHTDAETKQIILDFRVRI